MRFNIVCMFIILAILGALFALEARFYDRCRSAGGTVVQAFMPPQICIQGTELPIGLF